MFWVLLLGLVSADLDCMAFRWESQSVLVTTLQASPFKASVECLEKALRLHFFEAAYYIATRAVEQDLPIPAELKAQLATQQSQAESLLAKLEGHGKGKVIAPALQWTQSLSTVFVDVQFSHRLDSPGCLALNSHNIDITPDQVTFTGECVKSGEKLTLELVVELAAEVVPEESEYSLTSTGRVQFTLKKQTVEKWEKLGKGKKPPNWHVWWERQKKYEQELEEAEELDLEDLVKFDL